jgi:hypothetical protein
MRGLSIVLLLALCACGGHKPVQPASSAPPLLLDGRGTVMPLEQVVTHLSFRPYVPEQALEYAVLPPLGGADTDAHRGIGIEYVSGRTAMLLSEWPKQNFNIAFGAGRTMLSPCTPTHYSATAVGWTTPSNVLMTLQPDGPVRPRTVEREARRLIRAGACR